jgi:TonB-dependent receptor
VRRYPSPFAISLLAAAIGTSLFQPSAHAQQAQPPAADASVDETPKTLDSIQVTSSFQKSLDTALDKKRDDTRMTDGISSEDIGKFPSENIAEAIQRIPGVQISSINGRGSTISIRGLGPQYALTTINGQTFKSADFTDGFRFDIIQPEMAAAVDVIKSPTADMDAGGLSGTVNIETVKPLDYKEPKLIVSATGQYSDSVGGSPTTKFVGTYIDKFKVGDGELGVFLNAGYQKLKDRADYFWIDRWGTKTYEGASVVTPTRTRYRRIDRETERKMLNGALQWKPSDDFETGLTWIYSKDKTENDIKQQVFLLSSGTETVLEAANGYATRVQADNYTLENNRQLEEHNWLSEMATWDFKWTPGDWTVTGAANHALGKTHESEAAVIVGVPVGQSILDITNSSSPSFSSSNDLTDGGLYDAATLAGGRNQYPNGAIKRLRNQEDSLQLDGLRYLGWGWLDSVKVGAKYRRETLYRDIWRHDRLTDADISVLPTMSSSGQLASGFLDGEYDIQHAFVIPNLSAYAAALAAEGEVVPNLFVPQSSYYITNKIKSAYAMANIDTDLGSMRLRGNFGMRYEDTSRETKTYLTSESDLDEGEVYNIEGTSQSTYDYRNWLPSLNMVLELRPDLLLRASAAKVLVRPILTSSTAVATTEAIAQGAGGVVTHEISLGQTDLRALTANQADLSLEWYYQGGALTLNGFYKAIKNGTYNRNNFCLDSYNGVSISQGSDGECIGTNGEAYEFSQTLNSPDVNRLKGYELAWTQSLDAWLPVDGFGLTANYTRVMPSYKQDYVISNLSEKTWNATAYWENAMISARVSATHRSDYYQTKADSFFAYAGHQMKARTQLDGALGFRPNDTLSFTLGLVNITNEREEAYYQVSDIWQMTGATGRSYYLTAQWNIR